MNAPLRAFLKSLYGTVFPLFYRKIEVTGLENIPEKGPLILCANHSNAFLDALLLGIPFPHHVWYLARGDVFKGPVINRVLNALGILPIYRLQEGAENLGKNQEVFETCYRFLGGGGVIGIFPEGNAERESHLRPLKKGTARIVLGAFDGGFIPDDLQIIPAGINYEYPDHFGSRFMLRYGKPVSVADFLRQREIKSPRTATELTRVIYQAMSEVHIHIEDRHSQRAFYFLVNQFDAVFHTESRSGDDYFLLMKKWSVEWNRRSHEKEIGMQHFMHFEQSIHSLHQQHGILPAVMLHELCGMGAVQKFPSIATAFISYMFGLPGALFNALPFLWPHRLAGKMVKKPEFFHSVNVVGAGLIFMFWYLLAFMLLFFLFKPVWIRLLILFSLAGSGYLALRALHDFKRRLSLSKWKKFCRLHPQRAQDLSSEAEDILHWVKNFAADASARGA
jgi:1-acyl-sn-glycerol-3-phosphate acyltransferase